MKIYYALILLLIASCSTFQNLNQENFPEIPFESDSNSSANFNELMHYYEELAKLSKYVQIEEFGISDVGEPLIAVIIDADRKFDPIENDKASKNIFLINNGIHAGEPCGIDASMLLTKELLTDKTLFKLLKNTTVVIIPAYNLGGLKNRGSFSRANQNGPHEHGFRGNAKNLDLNRDFIKCDSRNAQSFNKLFTRWNPDIMVDTHTSNGADYQHIITCIATQKDKLAPALGSYLEFDFLPELYERVSEDGYDMSPYVYSLGATPDEKGIMSFPDLPRYSSGYAATHHSISFMPETHMLKPFKERVNSTKVFLLNTLEILDKDGIIIQQKREEAMDYYQSLSQVPIEWKMNENVVTTTTFKGYESDYKSSEISQLPRLYYDRDKAFTKEIPYYNTMEASKSVPMPQAYIIPQAYQEVINRLQWNGVEMSRLEKDEEILAEFYYIKDYETRESPYEGHYLHYNVTTEKQTINHTFYAGDYLIKLNQAANRFIIETLEPEAPDSYFAWNFFDGILMQKEYFSPYVFEDLAADFLEDNPKIKEALEVKKLEDEAFAKNAYQQLNFIYKQSPYYEQTHLRYPVGRIMKN